MKANEAPDKIYLFENPISSTPDYRWLSKRSDKNDIEYIRIDAFIEKLEDWMYDKFRWFAEEFSEGIMAKFDDIDMAIEDFKKYIKE